jgi:peptidoglycan hydrolase-like protein with peptidoglycan-binding domain
LPNPAPTVTKRSVQTIAVHAAPPPAVDTDAADQPMPDDLAPITEGEDASTDHDVVAAVQRGLNSLGFLHQQVDGVAGEATAKAIRNFEVYYRYDVTGRVTRELVRLLKQSGAVI